MKPKTSHKLAVVAMALACIAVFVIAIIKSSTFTPSVGPKVTQEAISRKLYHASHPQQLKLAIHITSVPPKFTTNSHTPDTQPMITSSKTMPHTLVNTGAGNTIAIFSLASLLGTIAAYALRLHQLQT